MIPKRVSKKRPTEGVGPGVVDVEDHRQVVFPGQPEVPLEDLDLQALVRLLQVFVVQPADADREDFLPVFFDLELERLEGGLQMGVLGEFLEMRDWRLRRRRVGRCQMNSRSSWIAWRPGSRRR